MYKLPLQSSLTSYISFDADEHALELSSALKEIYEVSEDWSRSLYIGVAIKWDYKNAPSGVQCLNMRKTF